MPIAAACGTRAEIGRPLAPGPTMPPKTASLKLNKSNLIVRCQKKIQPNCVFLYARIIL
jgi:hypothetical protein